MLFNSPSTKRRPSHTCDVFKIKGRSCLCADFSACFILCYRTCGISFSCIFLNNRFSRHFRYPVILKIMEHMFIHLPQPSSPLMTFILEWVTTVTCFQWRKWTAQHWNQSLFKNLLENTTPFIYVLSYFVRSGGS